MKDTVKETVVKEEIQGEITVEELQKEMGIQEKTLAEELLEEVEEVAEAAEVKAYSRPNFWKDNRGVGVIEIVLILVILIGLVLVFKEQITAISGDAGKIIN